MPFSTGVNSGWRADDALCNGADTCREAPEVLTIYTAAGDRDSAGSVTLVTVT